MVGSSLINGINPLDMYDIWINQIAGGWTIFIALMLIIIGMICAKLRVPNDSTMLLFIIFGLLMSPFTNGVLIITLITVSIFFTWTLSRIIGRLE